MKKTDSINILHPGCLVCESNNSRGRGGGRVADCSIEGQSSEFPDHECAEMRGSKPDREVNDVVYLSLVGGGRERDAHSELRFVLTQQRRTC